LFADDYYAVVDLDRVVAAKISVGGTAPQRVAEQIQSARDALARLEQPA
jgi:argininosuccinate lyase